MSQIPEPNRNSVLKSFVVQYHVRGRTKRQPLTTQCQTVQDIIELGLQSFPAFAERNPWICVDSKHATVFVGVDPERQSANEPPEAGPARNVSIKEESTQR